MQLICSSDLFAQKMIETRKRRHRVVCLLQGPEIKIQRWVEINFLQNPSALYSTLYFSASDQTFKTYLGSTYETIIFNAYAGFHPDKFCALVDALSGGGILFLMIPTSFEEWLDYPDPEYEKLVQLEQQYPAPRFLTRLISFFEQDKNSIWALDMSRESFNLENRLFGGATTTNLQKLTPTPDQKKITSEILALLKHGEAKLNLTADRGRGKSCLIAFLVAEAFKETPEAGRCWVLTTPNRSQAELIFQWLFHLFDMPNQFSHSSCQFIHQDQIFVYKPVASLIALDKPFLFLGDKDEKRIDFLIVDEAAGFPMHELQKLSERFLAIFFSTTVKGYEGSGQGFKLKFTQYLKNCHRDYHSFFLDMPLRWSNDDPLEVWLNQAFMLGESTMKFNCIDDPKNADLVIRQENREELVENRSLLESLYALLREAHYRTRPSDVRILLDAPGQYIWSAWKGVDCIGVVWVCQDGPLPRHLWSPIIAGKRRLKGHLIPQAMAGYTQTNQWLDKRIGRIIRIAVHADFRRMGVASALILAVEQFARQQAWNALGTSFSSYDQSVKFWKKLGFKIARHGNRKNASTGKRAMIFIKSFLSTPPRSS